MNDRIKEFARQAGFKVNWQHADVQAIKMAQYREFAELIVRACIDKIETYRIPVGNSAAGELACEWTYEALKEISDDIKQHFGVQE